MYLFTSHLLVQRLAGFCGGRALASRCATAQRKPRLQITGGIPPLVPAPATAYPLPYFPTPATLAKTTK